ncbi:hypothetical protein [Pedobacter sp. Leaf170]|uniref:hypothetical protein n=1 Tax=Pedobacter sp. Leaf170 TaxID=2876558 RepID=UPI001E2E3950|nr:hypothetical protein [Pedobacter sp. Leaf170]
MAKLHHTKVKSAVAKYSGLHAEGKTSDEVKTAIAADENGYDAEGVEEIYNAIITPAPEKPEANVFTVIKEFRDISNFDKIHKVGADVSDFDTERLAALVANGHVEKA